MTEPNAPEPIDEAEAGQPLPDPRPVATESQPATTEPQPAAGRVDPALVVLASLTTVLLVSTVLFAWMVFAPTTAPVKLGATRLAAQAEEREAIIATAERVAENFVSIDHRTLDRDFRRLARDATPSLREQLTDVLGSEKKRFLEEETVSEGIATDSLVLRERPSPVVRVVIERTVSNVDTERPRRAVQVFDVTLEPADGRWKADDIRQVGPEDG